MGNWYKVTKSINGCLYDYWQRTTRIGKSVKTENKYIGPAHRGAPLSPSTYSATAPTTPEDVMGHLLGSSSTGRKPGNLHELKREKKRLMHVDDSSMGNELNAVIDEIEYAYAVKRSKKQIRDAKRQTKGIKAFNPFMAKVLKS
jgi:hypothetical protein